jgi:hypothetical protein
LLVIFTTSTVKVEISAGIKFRGWPRWQYSAGYIFLWSSLGRWQAGCIQHYSAGCKFPRSKVGRRNIPPQKFLPLR